jgi:hypothetical protein
MDEAIELIYCSFDTVIFSALLCFRGRDIILKGKKKPSSFVYKWHSSGSRQKLDEKKFKIILHINRKECTTKFRISIPRRG